MSNYPKKAYEENETENLESLGFCPNALLHVHIIQEDPKW